MLYRFWLIDCFNFRLFVSRSIFDYLPHLHFALAISGKTDRTVSSIRHTLWFCPPKGSQRIVFTASSSYWWPNVSAVWNLIKMFQMIMYVSNYCILSFVRRIMDLREYLIKIVTEFVYQLIYSGDLLMGKALRMKLLEKYVAKLQYNANLAVNGSLSAQNIYTR